MNEHKEIWEQIKGSEKLFEIYTYFPTLHDAKIKNITLNFEERSFSLTVDYCDFIKQPEDAINTEFIICWLNVQKADFDWYSEDVNEMEFSFENGFIKTTFTDSFGFDGVIVSSEIEIVNVRIETEKEQIHEGNTIKFSIR